MIRSLRICFLPSLVLAAWVPAAVAEHEADHRYVIEGFVLDEAERPRAEVPVNVRMDGRPLGSARTGRAGHYRIDLHLHDRDIGSELVLRAGEHEARIRMTATRGDRRTARVHAASFVGGRLVEEELEWWRLPLWGYVAAGAATVLLALAVVGARLVRARKRTERKAARQRASAGVDKRKRKRRKRR